MLNKDKRSLIFCLVLGDGSLGSYRGGGEQTYGRLTVDHGKPQADYLSWKANLVLSVLGKKVSIRQGHKGNSVQFAISSRRLKAWHKFTYTNGKKDREKLFKYIRHPELALAIWLGDDGYNEPNGSQLRLFSCGSLDQKPIVEWLKQFGVNPIVKTQKVSRINKSYEYVKFNVADSLILWKICREFLLQFKSMQHKFRFIEQKYQQKCLQRTPPQGDDIVSAGINT